MVRIQILSGKSLGTACLKRFPAFIGRAPSCDLRLEENGIWDRHLEIHLDAQQGFFVKTHSGGLTFLNGANVQEERLRNGDVIELGAIRLQFWLAEMPQRNFGVREVVTWIGLGILSASQVGLIYWLLQNG